MVGALADLQELRAEFCRTTSPNDVVSGLLSLAEVWTSLGIAGHLSEILSTIRIHQWLFEQYGDLRLFSIPSGKPTVSPAVLQIWQTILADWDLSDSIEKLKLGDAVLVLTAEGRELLNRLSDDPLALLKYRWEQMEDLEAREQPPTHSSTWKLFWSVQMEPVIRWSMANQYKVDLREVSLDDELKRIHDHFVKWGSGHIPDPRECVAVGYPFYHALFAVLRLAAYQSPLFAEVLDHYSLFHESLSKAGHEIDHRFWDRVVFECDRSAREDTVRTLGTKLGFEEHPAWPIHNHHGALKASALLLGVGSKELRDIRAKPSSTGAWFEEVVADELSNMRIPIERRNVEIPGGEIDIVFFDAPRHYAEERKDQ